MVNGSTWVEVDYTCLFFCHCSLPLQYPTSVAVISGSHQWRPLIFYVFTPLQWHLSVASGVASGKWSGQWQVEWAVASGVGSGKWSGKWSGEWQVEWAVASGMDSGDWSGQWQVE